MGIGPFTTYAPPNVYTRTVAEPVISQLLGGLRIPVLIGTAKETLSQTNFELVRGSSSVADTPVFGEDMTGRAVVSGSNAAPVLGAANGTVTKFKVRNFPIVDGFGIGKSTFDPTKVTATVNGRQAVVSTVDGPNGIVQLLIPPAPSDVVVLSYYFHRGDTRITDDLSSQVTSTPAVLVAPRAETYDVLAGTNDVLLLTVDDILQVSVQLTAGLGRAASDVANDINAAAVTGLSASVHVDAQGLSHVQLQAQGNILIGSGNGNGALGFDPGASTQRNATFRVVNGPIVDGTGGGITTTDPSRVTVVVNGAQVLAQSVDGSNSYVTLPFAPKPGSIVAVTYYFNTWQDTFDYLPNHDVVNVGNVGISPGRRDYLSGPDFVVINQGEQSIIQWGTAFLVTPGVRTGTATFDSVQVTGLLVDNRIYGTPCARYTDPNTAAVSETKFVLPITPTTGNGRDTPLGLSIYQTVTNSRIDLPTNRPDLVIVYVGKTWRDAKARPPVTVKEVDSATNTFVLKDPVPADYQAFATFWYNRIADDVFNFSVITSGPSGVGQYKISSQSTGSDLFGARWISKSGLSQTVQWPSGVEYIPDALHSGSGSPVPETVTVTFSSSLNPASHASFSNSRQDPYDIYAASRIFGGVVVDGGAPVSVDLSTAYRANLLGNPVASAVTMLATDRLVLVVDGVTLGPIDISAATTVALAATAINAFIDADVQVHADGSGTFASTAPNALASATSYGSEVILRIRGRNVKSFTNGLDSGVLVLVPTSSGQTDGSSKLGLAPNMSASGSYSAINQVATLVATKTGPYAITSGLNNNLQLALDGLDFSVTLPTGPAVDLDDVVTAINDAYISVAPAADIATLTADLVALANDLKAKYNTHIASTVYHLTADVTNPVSATNATDLATAIVLVNEIRTDYAGHLDEAGVHQLDDTVNTSSLGACTDLQTAVLLAHDLKEKFNLHLLQLGVHGHDDITNTEALSDALTATIIGAADNGSGLIRLQTAAAHGFTTGDLVYVSGVLGTTEANSAAPGNWTITSFDATHFDLVGSTFTNPWSAGGTQRAQDFTKGRALVNDLKAKFNLHRVQSGSHLANDTVNIVAVADVTTDNVNGPWTQSAALANDIKAKFNAHIASTTYHSVADTTNTVAAADATSGSLTSFFTLVNALKAAYNAHLLQLQGSYHVHGTNDLVNASTAVLSELVAHTGAGSIAGKLWLSSRVNSPASNIGVSSAGTANDVLGFTGGASAGRVQPTAKAVAGALNANSSFAAAAVAYGILVSGLGNFLEINSRTAGSASTLSFTSVSSTAFIEDTGLGIVPGTSSAVGEPAQAGFTVSSSAGLSGSHGTGFPGQTYTDATTGLRFTVLPASAGDYDDGGSFTMAVGQTFTCNATIPIRCVGGVEVTVFNTSNMNPGTTAVLTTYPRSGTSPKIGDVYYISYDYAKTDTSTGLFRDNRAIEQAFGPATPSNPLSLGARFALLNGAVIVGLKQVPRAPDSSQATLQSFVEAIDEQRKPISGSVKPDVIAPMATDPQIFSYLNQHCVFMSTPRQEGERTAVVGTAVGTNPLGVQAIAQGLASELMVVAYPDSYVITLTDDQGNLIDQLIDGSYAAAAIAGSECNPSVDVAVPWTRRVIAGFKSLGRVLDPTEANSVAVAGVTILDQIDNAVRIRHGLTTRIDSPITRTPSVTLTVQFVQQTVRKVLNPYIGQKFTGAVIKAVEGQLTGAFGNLIDQQIVQKVIGISVYTDQDDPTILRADVIYIPIFPLEYIVATLFIRVRA
jgi:hypothetical protein